MSRPDSWQATAFNQSTDSSNQIHSDEVAQAYGFKGGLVPGVTVSSYLIHPAVIAWGSDWLSCGSAHVVVGKPLYDGYEFSVDLTDVTADSYRATLTDQQDTQCATAYLRLNTNQPEPPTMRGDPILERGQDIPDATREEMEILRDKGMSALRTRWSAANNMATYLEDSSKMPEIHRFNGDGYANAAFLLGLTNWVLAGNAYMNPWIHLQTESQNYVIVKNDTELAVECDIEDLFSKKGHEFVDLNVAVYVANTGQPAMTARLRAIYKLREVSD
ncbi:MAG: hypothetical protein QF715_01425 [Pseudomonadales bacterium]|nr:hypothetical protein [Pseudomonadales bacterium]MDP6314603.1 hypothetical protein [Pseudomonadales bacterium]MDP7313416.1 hypothetical protein [Pseudomonadales bacterium]